MLQDRDGQVVEAHSASAGLDYPGIGPQLAALAEAGRLEVGDGDGPRGRRRDEDHDPGRGHPAGARDRARDRRAAQAPRRSSRAARSRGPTRRWSCSASPAAATRISRRSSGSPTSSHGPRAGDHRRAPGVLPVAARDAREGDLGRRRACRRRHLPGEGQDLRDDGARRPGGASIRTTIDQQAELIATFPGVVRSCAVCRPVRLGRRRTSTTSTPTILRGIVEGAWRRTAPKAVVAAFDRGAARDAPPSRRRRRHERHRRRAADRRRLRARPRRRRAALIPYVVAGYPDADTTSRSRCAAIDAGADLLEVGLPYSDPLADGATLQRASQAALAAGATLDALAARSSGGSRAPARTSRSCRWATPTSSSAVATAGSGRAAPRGRRGRRRDRGRPDARRGRAVRGRRAPTPGSPSSTSSPRRRPPARRAEVAARSGGFLYCVSLVGVTGARTLAAASTSAGSSAT